MGWCEEKSKKKTQGVLEVDDLTSINAQLASVNNILQNLALRQDSMTKAPVQSAAIMTQTTIKSCVYEEHTFDQCPNNPTSIFIWEIKLVKATRKIIYSQTLITHGGETIQTSHGRDKAHTINECHLNQITL